MLRASHGDRTRSHPSSRHTASEMDPARKRTIRLVVALTCALLLAVALVYTSFSASSEAREPSQLGVRAARQDLPADGQGGQGQLAPRRARCTRSASRTARAAASVPVRYRGSVPDPFREGREIVIDVRKEGSAFVGQPDSLVTKCPSKFTAEPSRPEARVPTAGRACLIIALAVCLYGIAASLYGARTGRRELVASAPARGLRAGRACWWWRWRSCRARSCARTSPSRSSRATPRRRRRSSTG